MQKLTQNAAKTLNVRSKTTQLLEENKGQKLPNMGFGNDFLDMTPRHRQQKNK